MPTARQSPCPVCHVIGRLDITMQLVANPIGTYSIAGAQTKVTAQQRPVLDCTACGLHVVGTIEDDHAVFPSPEPRPASDPAANSDDDSPGR